MNEQIISQAVEARLAGDALAKALREWQTKLEIAAPFGFLKQRASAPDPKPPSKADWLRKRTAEILEEA